MSFPGPQETVRATRLAGRRWVAGAALAALTSMGLVLLFMLTQATGNRELYEKHYLTLLTINIVVAAFLAVVILWIAFRLILRLRRGKFGSRLLVKLAAIFALVGLVPGLLVYTVSYAFVSRSIESWFDVRVEGALEAGLNLGRATLDALTADLSAKTRQAAVQLGDVPEATSALALERVRDQLGATDVALWSATGHLIASTGQSRFELNPERPSPQLMRLARAQRVFAQVEGFDEVSATATARARIRAMALVVPSGSFGLAPEPRYLQVSRTLPESVVANALAVQDANREYQERALARGGLRRMYIGTLTLSLFLAVFGAIVLAVLLGNQLARPLLLIAEGVRQVAAGDFTPKAALQGRDELGGLTRSFADMTRQLADARQTADQSLAQLDAARASLQTILDNLTAGVMVLDALGHMMSANPGATRILREPLAAYEGRLLRDVPGLEAFAARVAGHFEEFLAARAEHGLDHWQQSFELAGTTGGPFSHGLMLIARGAILPDGSRLLVFDDISEIVSAQRAQAWGEVARRLAHEIKNPLTPIQLSAERLEMKLTGKLSPPEQAVLTKSVRTIVDQVDAMKRLVNEFRDYARLPAAELVPLDLNALVRDILLLYPDESVAGAESVPVRADLDPQCPLIRGDAHQLRQVIHNLLQNAQDACESVGAEERRPVVTVRTQWQAAACRVRLSVIDEGPGFPDRMLKRAFEPYVTTKAKGTGLGLAVVKKIADEHGARVEVLNRAQEGRVLGAQVSLSFAAGNHGAA